jgi:predicted DNA binding CopG/RHH family protein
MGKTITFKASDQFAEHIGKQAVKKGLKVGTFIKAVLKKHTNFKEKDLV